MNVYPISMIKQYSVWIMVAEISYSAQYQLLYLGICWFAIEMDKIYTNTDGSSKENE